jgi:hypothetical protein
MKSTRADNSRKDLAIQKIEVYFDGMCQPYSPDEISLLCFLHKV